jgi:hypothetical protein
MAKVNLAGMNVEALLSLRTQIDKRLLELRTARPFPAIRG